MRADKFIYNIYCEDHPYSPKFIESITDETMANIFAQDYESNTGLNHWVVKEYKQ